MSRGLKADLRAFFLRLLHKVNIERTLDHVHTAVHRAQPIQSIEYF